MAHRDRHSGGDAVLVAAAAFAYPALILVPMGGGKVLACTARSLGAFGLSRYQDAVPGLRGAAGERTVGPELRRLDRPGWRVRHDARKPAAGKVDHARTPPSRSRPS